jgi:hypothetical protein
MVMKRCNVVLLAKGYSLHHVTGGTVIAAMNHPSSADPLPVVLSSVIEKEGVGVVHAVGEVELPDDAPYIFVVQCHSDAIAIYGKADPVEGESHST